MKVVIPHEIHKKIMFWVRNTDIEVSGLGKVMLDKETQTYRVTSAMLLKQIGTGTTTSIDADAVAKAMFETRNEEGTLAFWWHSHVKMQAFWSGTDTQTIEDTASGGLCIASVFNHQGDSKTAIAFKTQAPWGEHIVRYDDVPMTVEQLPPSEDEVLWRQELTTKLSKPEPVVTPMWGEHVARPVTHRQMSMLEHWRNPHDAEAGITGMGIDTEARMLGVSVKALKKIIKRGERDKVFQEYEERLYKQW